MTGRTQALVHGTAEGRTIVQTLEKRGADIAGTKRAPGRKPAAGRPRNEEIGDQILSTARALLAESGYDALTFEAIGSRTGIGRPTIYRRWPSKVHLVAEIAYGPDGEDLRETGGDLMSQLLSLVRQVAQSYYRPEVVAATAGLNSAFQYEPALREELHKPAEAGARRQLAGIVDRLKARREIVLDADPDLLFDMIIGAVTFRLIFSSFDRDDDFETALAQKLHRAFKAV
jgi:AcrR family transcriptional regulator